MNQYSENWPQVTYICLFSDEGGRPVVLHCGTSIYWAQCNSGSTIAVVVQCSCIIFHPQKVPCPIKPLNFPFCERGHCILKYGWVSVLSRIHWSLLAALAPPKLYILLPLLNYMHIIHLHFAAVVTLIWFTVCTFITYTHPFKTQKKTWMLPFFCKVDKLCRDPYKPHANK